MVQCCVFAGALLLQSDYMFCEKCGKHFADSYIQTHFDYNICNVCRYVHLWWHQTASFSLVSQFATAFDINRIDYKVIV